MKSKKAAVLKPLYGEVKVVRVRAYWRLRNGGFEHVSAHLRTVGAKR